MSIDLQSLEVGTCVWTANIMGKTPGGRVHAAVGTVSEYNWQRSLIVTRKPENGVRLSSYCCDGDLQNGVPGMWRGFCGVVCEIDQLGCTTGNEFDALDVAITCEKCRRNLGLKPLKQSVNGGATLAAALEVDKILKRIAVLEDKIEGHERWAQICQDSIPKTIHINYVRYYTQEARKAAKFLDRDTCELDSLRIRLQYTPALAAVVEQRKTWEQSVTTLQSEGEGK